MVLMATYCKEIYTMDGNVHVLTSPKTTSFVNENKYALVYGFVPQCNICQQVDGFLQDLSVRLDRFNGIKVGKIDIASNMDVQKLLRATFMPYITLFYNGVQKPYEGAINIDDLYNWVENLVNKEANIIIATTNDDYNKFTENNFAIGFKFPETDVKAQGVLEAFAKLFSNTKFYKLTKDATNDLKNDYEFVLRRQFDDGDKIISGATMPELSMMQQFYELFNRPYIIELDDAVVDEIYRTRRPTVFIFDRDYNSEVIEKLNNDAFKYRQSFLLVKSKLDEPSAVMIAELFDITKDNLPAIGIIDFKGAIRKFRTVKGNAYVLKAFIDSYLNNDLVEFFKGEPVPSVNSPVRKVVRDNFNAVVNDNSKHVMVGFFSESCIYCSELHEAFAKAQKELREGHQDIVFAKVDIDKNDIDVKINGLPAIYFYKIDDKKNPVEFPLIRDWEVILDWIESQLSRQDIYSKPMPEHLKNDLPEGYYKAGDVEENKVDDIVEDKIEEL